jgi:hypothetical protein
MEALPTARDEGPIEEAIVAAVELLQPVHLTPLVVAVMECGFEDRAVRAAVWHLIDSDQQIFLGSNLEFWSKK